MPGPAGDSSFSSRTLARLVLVAGILSSFNPAFAKECGDDLEGRRVACACGDTVVSDTVLRPGDPIVSGRCLSGGLIVRARGLAETIRLDLAGLSMVGSGVGDGISVVEGGSDGAVLIGGTSARRGEIVGFGTGVNVRLARAARRIEFLEVEGQRHEGLLLRSAGTFVTGVRALRNGGDGVRVSGNGGRLLDIEAIENDGAGVRVSSSYTILAARADRNREHGIIVRGAHVTIDGSVATSNTGYGVMVGGRRCSATDVVTADNTKGGLTLDDRRQNP
jgi:hypothetical protein